MERSRASECHPVPVISGAFTMSKGEDKKKETKKQPAKTMKEKKEAKKAKKDSRSSSF